MKLKNNLIVTLPDFARYFDYTEFWENRRQFVRDMHPSKVYYWNNELLKAYDDIALWIAGGENAEEEAVNNGILALEVLIGRPIRKEEIEDGKCRPDLSGPIIRVLAGTTLDLPQYTDETPDVINLRYHKIEVYGHSNKPAIINIGSRGSITLYATEFTYVTEVENLFIEFLPTHIQNNIYDLNLACEDGVFLPTLNVRALFSGTRTSYKDVVSFAVADDGFVFIDSQGNPVIMSSTISELKFMLKHDGKAFYVKARGKQTVILYKDGTMKSTAGGNTTGKVIYADV